VEKKKKKKKKKKMNKPFRFNCSIEILLQRFLRRVVAEMEADETCSCIVFGDENVHQPCFQAQDVRVCQACAECCFVPGVGGVTQRVSETKAFACECRHLPGGHFCLFAAASPCPELKNVLRPRLLTIFQDTVGKKHVMGTISAHLEIARVFDNEEAQQEAMELLPPEILQIAYPDSGERDDLKLFSALLAWFKTFFSWVGQAGLTCGVCGSNKTRVIGGTFPTAEEQKWRVGNVEVFACDDCKQHTRFPRFNNARKLLQTRRGRCGEYAQAFSLICASLQYSTRLVVDLTDHVWTEVKIGKKWLHADTGEVKHFVLFLIAFLFCLMN
jgi:hypothetical protein